MSRPIFTNLCQFEEKPSSRPSLAPTARQSLAPSARHSIAMSSRPSLAARGPTINGRRISKITSAYKFTNKPAVVTTNKAKIGASASAQKPTTSAAASFNRNNTAKVSTGKSIQAEPKEVVQTPTERMQSQILHESTIETCEQRLDKAIEGLQPSAETLKLAFESGDDELAKLFIETLTIRDRFNQRRETMMTLREQFLSSLKNYADYLNKEADETEKISERVLELEMANGKAKDNSEEQSHQQVPPPKPIMVDKAIQVFPERTIICSPTASNQLRVVLPTTPILRTATKSMRKRESIFPNSKDAKPVDDYTFGISENLDQTNSVFKNLPFSKPLNFDDTTILVNTTKQEYPNDLTYVKHVDDKKVQQVVGYGIKVELPKTPVLLTDAKNTVNHK